MDLKPTMKEYANGTKVWFLNGKLHREDGPAIEAANGSKAWHLNDKLHRVNGPACEYASGSKGWWVHGECLTLMEFLNHDLVSDETVQEVLIKWI